MTPGSQKIRDCQVTRDEGSSIPRGGRVLDCIHDWQETESKPQCQNQTGKRGKADLSLMACDPKKLIH